MSILSLFSPTKTRWVKSYAAYRTIRSNSVRSRSTPQGVVKLSNYMPITTTASVLDTILWGPRGLQRPEALAGPTKIWNPAKKQTPSRLLSLPQLNTVLDTTRSVANVRTKEAGSICNARRTRRQMMFAFNHAGKLGQKPKTFGPNSNIHCERIY
jgi:hypothetical protein